MNYQFIEENTPWLQELLMNPLTLDSGVVVILKKMNNEYIYLVQSSVADQHNGLRVSDTRDKLQYF